MKIKAAWFVAICLLPLPLAAQAPTFMAMDQVPHRHLALHNDHVNVFQVEVSPQDSIVQHRHDQDTIAIGQQTDSSAYKCQPLLESGGTRVRHVRVLPRQSANLGELAGSGDACQVTVAPDAAAISSGPSKEKEPAKALQLGDFVWIDGGPGREYLNRGDK